MLFYIIPRGQNRGKKNNIFLPLQACGEIISTNLKALKSYRGRFAL